MVVVSVLLAACICVVWWQDKRTEQIQMLQMDEELKMETCSVTQEEVANKDNKQGINVG